MAEVFKVADFFIRFDTLRAEAQRGEYITNLRLQKLLYLAQGWFMARTGKPLFEHDFLAWQYGPVVKEVYARYAGFGDAGIICQTSDLSNCFTSREMEVLLDVARTYEDTPTSRLVDITHAPGSPWAKTRLAVAGDVISKDIIKAYFSSCTPLPTISFNHIPVVEALPKDWYDSEEDAEWESYL